LTGILVGPHSFGWVSKAAEVEALAEIGVMLLLFTLGLEFSLTKLFRMRRVVLGMGSIQVVLSILITVLLCIPLGIYWPQNLFWGFIVSLSSTAIVLKRLLERAETESVHGRVSLGILIFQDLCVIPMMVVLPVLKVEGPILLPFALALAKAGVVVMATVLGARFLFPRILYWIVCTRNKELFVIASILILVGTAWAISLSGLSLALGAFLAGLVLSESEYNHQILADIRPFRDSMNSLFFISVGMLVDPALVLRQYWLIGALILAVLMEKSLLICGIVYLSKYPIRVALLVGMGLAQVGEFSFVLLKEGLRFELVTDYWYQIVLTTSVGTMILTPIIFDIASRLAGKTATQSWAKRFEWKQGLKEISDRGRPLRDHVIICGYGTSGANLARALRQNALPYLVLEINAETVKREQIQGESISFGDCAQENVLRHAGIENARALVIAISDPFSTRTATRLARIINSNLFIIVRTRYMAEVKDLYELGASELVTEEFESSIEVLTRILRIYLVPRNIISEEVVRIREERYAMFRDLHVPATFLSERGPLSKAQTDSFLLMPNSAVVGKSIKDLQLRAKTGASIVAVMRENNPFVNPPPDFLIRPRDVLILLGNPEELEKCLHYLEEAQTP
jgi:CPA2 family monovalent cation:H+ antiporter-2